MKPAIIHAQRKKCDLTKKEASKTCMFVHVKGFHQKSTVTALYRHDLLWVTKEDLTSVCGPPANKFSLIASVKSITWLRFAWFVDVKSEFFLMHHNCRHSTLHRPSEQQIDQRHCLWWERRRHVSPALSPYNNKDKAFNWREQKRFSTRKGHN